LTALVAFAFTEIWGGRKQSNLLREYPQPKGANGRGIWAEGMAIQQMKHMLDARVHCALVSVGLTTKAQVERYCRYHRAIALALPVA
jgi:hypothetical protein